VPTSCPGTPFGRRKDSGTAGASNDRARIAELWTAADRAWWDDAEDPAIRLLTVDPGDAELWKGPNRIAAAARLALAAATGAKSDFGENVKLDGL